LWIVKTDGEVWATPAIADIDKDGVLEVVVGSTDGKLYIINGINGMVETSITIGAPIYASAALADLDGDDYLEIVVGSTDGKAYCFQWNNVDFTLEWNFETYGPIYSSAAIGDIDGDKKYEIIIGSTDGKVYSLDYTGKEIWSYQTGGPIYSSPALFDWAYSAREAKPKYSMEWPMFRHNPRRTGFYSDEIYGKSSRRSGLDILIGSNDGYLYWIHGRNGALIDRFKTYGEIHTSPAIADVDNDGKLEVFFYDWSPYDTMWALEIELTYPRAIRILLHTTSPPTQNYWQAWHRYKDGVKSINFEDYVSYVLPHEWWYWEWKKFAKEYGIELVRESWIAGALTIKTYAWYHIVTGDKHPSEIADLCDWPCCQRYVEVSYSETNETVKDTWSQFLLLSSKPFSSEYWNGRVKVVTEKAIIRKEPNPTSEIIAILEKGTILYVLDGFPTNGWRLVTWELKPEGKRGWIQCGSISPTEARANIVNEQTPRLTQYGSLYWALQGWNFEAILRHFYGEGIQITAIS
jgi:hypothetical protein